VFTVLIFQCISPPSRCTTSPSLRKIGGYETHVFAQGASEIVSFDKEQKRLFVINAQAGVVDVLDVLDPTNVTKLFSFHVNFMETSGINSVACHSSLAAVAVQGILKTDPGFVEIYDISHTGVPQFLRSFQVGSLPDNVVFSPNGRYVLAACEGEPSDDYSIDPEGSVAIIDLQSGVERAEVRLATFEKYNDGGLPEGVRLTKGTVAQDIEPEYIAVSTVSNVPALKAYVTLQENNAIAVVDVDSAQIENVFALGVKDYSLPGNGFDASDRDTRVNVRTWNHVVGLYMPDTIIFYQPKNAGQLGNSYRAPQYLITANEGDGRTWGTYTDEARVSSLYIDFTKFTAPDIVNAALGRLTVSKADGYTVNNLGMKVYHTLHTFGTRSFSIWNAETGELVYDSGDDLENITAIANPSHFNSNHEEAKSFDTRSDNKGPEPEVVKVGYINDIPLLFVGLERQSGVVMYDLSDVSAPRFLQYVNPRNFLEIDIKKQGDLGPEGFSFLDAEDSPTGNPLLAVGNEISGSTAIYEITC
jgi:hypothetical protein